ncbi:MipA/OmpV family protein [Sphingomonas sp. BIUV-7]|uniref:MipA/OmpV family protein n=1 Tax=Sphingomonas natans TaxID=3063330 RepID=A0ABT8YAN7_9SPHN|nr:MipA/OmpV family protein [Sphingomonas sp. BIUV-7]MDO6415391.1 MipA/OmpV family protein [Sphingomonas sp. BIUV-7]
MMPQTLRSVLPGFAMFMVAMPAAAQVQIGTEGSHPVADDAPTQSDGQLSIGAGASYAPAYEGARRYRLQPLPMIDLSYGRFFANLFDGVGVTAIRAGAVDAGASVTIMPGYRRRDAPKGIGRLPLGAGGRVFVKAGVAGFQVTAGATKGFVGSTRGTIADVAVSRPMAVSSRVVIIPSLAASWADAKHNHRYFGVSAAQAAASGLSRYRPGSGAKDVTASIAVSYSLTPDVRVSASSSVARLLGDDADSPIVSHKTRASGFLSATYSFGL